MCASSVDGSLLDALLVAHAVLESEDIAHALCGGVASNLYRDEVRATIDVDLYIACSGPRLVDLARKFENKGWTAHPAWRQADLLRLERKDLPRVDLLIASTDFEREAIERAVAAVIDDTQIRVLTPEDLIVFKLVAGRARDYEATAAILNSNKDIDRDFVERSLKHLGQGDIWERALEEARREAQGAG